MTKTIGETYVKNKLDRILTIYYPHDIEFFIDFRELATIETIVSSRLMTVFEAKFDREIAIFKNSFEELNRKGDQTALIAANAMNTATSAEERASGAQTLAEEVDFKANELQSQLDSDINETKTDICNIYGICEKKKPGSTSLIEDYALRRCAVIEWWTKCTKENTKMAPAPIDEFYILYFIWGNKKKPLHDKEMFHHVTSELIKDKIIPSLKITTTGEGLYNTLEYFYTGRKVNPSSRSSNNLSI
jgi:hypothetical protein